MEYILLGVAFIALAIGVTLSYLADRKVSSADRIEPHVPDPRDTEIVFLRERVIHLEAMLHGTTRADNDTMANLLRDHLLGTGTGLAAPDAVVDGEDGGPDLGGYDEADWTDDYIVLPNEGALIPPPPAEFPTP